MHGWRIACRVDGALHSYAVWIAPERKARQVAARILKLLNEAVEMLGQLDPEVLERLGAQPGRLARID